MKENKVHKIITEEIIKQLKTGNLKWLKDWNLGFGKNYISRKEYSGINALLINMSLHSRGFKHNEWLTFNQIISLKARLNKGSKATQIIYFNVKEYCGCGQKGCELYKTNPDELHYLKAMPILRYYNVYNIDNTDLKSKEENKIKLIPLVEVERILNKYWDLKSISLGNPSYAPELDKIFMPDINNFETAKGYYSALTHELLHSTGHKTRLARRGITESNINGSSGYAYEELVAELGSAFLCADLNIEKDIKNTSAYIKVWLKSLRNDNTFIFKASADARKGQEFIIKCQENEENGFVR